MNLQDLAKKTIDEVSNEIEQQEVSFKEQGKEEKTEEKLIEPVYQVQEIQQKEQTHSQEEKVFEPKLLQTQKEPDEAINISEDIFLKNLRERILVLFEGLNTIKKDELEVKLGLTINFLEFLLANIEDKLKK